MNHFLHSAIVLVAFTAIVYSAAVPDHVDTNEQEVEPQPNQLPEQSNEEGTKVPLPDTRPITPLQPLKPVPHRGPSPAQVSTGPQIGIGNLVNLRRFGPWQDLGLDVLGGLIQVTVNRAPGNRNVAVRIGNHEINVG